jgi:hypothetical protein
MYRIGLGDFGECCGLGNIPWGYLGQDGSEDIMGPTLEEIAGGPVDTITASDIATYATTGTTSDPSILSQVANIVKALGPTTQQILQQIQLGQIASSASVQNLPAVRAAIVGASPISTTISSLAANPMILVGAGLLVVLLIARRK